MDSKRTPKLICQYCPEEFEGRFAADQLRAHVLQAHRDQMRYITSPKISKRKAPTLPEHREDSGL